MIWGLEGAVFSYPVWSVVWAQAALPDSPLALHVGLQHRQVEAPPSVTFRSSRPCTRL